METVKGAIQAAEKVIWGEQPKPSGEEPISGVKGEGTPSDPYDAGNVTGNEPISGVKGQGTASDPYDAGNVSQASNPDPVNFHENSKSTGGSATQATGRHPVAPTSGIVPVGATLPGAAESSLSGAPSGPFDSSHDSSDKIKRTEPSNLSSKLDTTGGGIKPAMTQGNTTSMSSATSGPFDSSQTSSGGMNSIEPLKLTQTPDTSQHSSFIGGGLKPAKTPGNTTSALSGADKPRTAPTDAPSTGLTEPAGSTLPKSSAAKQEGFSTSQLRPTAPEVIDAYHNQLPSHSRPIDDKGSSTVSSHGHSDTSHGMSGVGSGIHSEEHHPAQRTQETNDGLSADSSHEQTKPNKPKEPEAARKPEPENIVKSTGFAAEGGDFDAKEPGAGYEADRLLEDEHKQDPNYVPPAKTTGAHKDTHEQQKGEHHGGHQTNSHKSKISLTKVKEKLHIGKSRDS